MKHFISAIPDEVGTVTTTTDDTTTTYERSSRHTIELGRITIVALSIICTTIVAIRKPDTLTIFSTISVACVSGYFGVAQQRS